MGELGQAHLGRLKDWVAPGLGGWTCARFGSVVLASVSTSSL